MVCIKMLGASNWGFANITTNFQATVGSSPGVAVTSSASANTDGSNVTLLGSLAHDVHFLLIAVSRAASPSSQYSCALLDILQDPAGGTSFTNLIDDLLVAARVVVTTTPYGNGFAFPIYIKSSTSLGVRIRTPNAAALAFNVLCMALGNPIRPDQWWCGSKVETLGANAASSRGTPVTPVAGSYGSWTNIPTSGTTSGRYGYIQVGYGGAYVTSVATASSNLLQIGYSSAKLPGSPTWYIGENTTNESCVDRYSIPLWCDIPVGTQMQARIRASVLTNNPEIALYGVY